MTRRVEFVCQLSTCRRHVEIEIPTDSGTGQVSNPRCTCGSEMKKVYSKPVVRELSKEEAMECLGDSEPPKSLGKAAGGFGNER